MKKSFFFFFLCFYLFLCVCMCKRIFIFYFYFFVETHHFAKTEINFSFTCLSTQALGSFTCQTKTQTEISAETGCQTLSASPGWLSVIQEGCWSNKAKIFNSDDFSPVLRSRDLWYLCCILVWNLFSVSPFVYKQIITTTKTSIQMPSFSSKHCSNTKLWEKDCRSH